MHPENVYAKGLDLDRIYCECEEARYWLYLNENGKAKMLNLPGQEAFFTMFLLKRDFQFDATLGPGIVPILPLRINFLLYTRDFINSLRGELPTEKPVLIDLGCGPVAIVSVLGELTFRVENLELKEFILIELDSRQTGCWVVDITFHLTFLFGTVPTII